MTERLLQYIWQFRHFNLSALQTAENESLSIIHPGTYNTNQGPDFLDARIMLGNTTWAGHIELHVLSSQWKAHGHGSDKNYDNVILHVVWEHDEDLQLPFPTLELQHRVPKLLLNKFAALMQHSGFIACETKAATIDSIIWQSWKARLLAERLADKSKLVESFLQENNYHWEETCWWLLARSFGAKVNTDAFEAMARSLPIAILAKHKHQLIQLEALILGQAGLLENDFNEKYPAMLQREYRFLQKKYGLAKISVQLHFLRMRPSNFPTVRLAQLAMLVHQSQNLFSKLKETTDIHELRKQFSVTANDYWHYHYLLDEESRFREKNWVAR